MLFTGQMQSHGGDPVSAEILDDKGEKIPLEIKDNEDGTYDVKFTAHRPSTYCLKVRKTNYETFRCCLGSFLRHFIWKNIRWHFANVFSINITAEPTSESICKRAFISIANSYRETRPERDVWFSRRNFNSLPWIQDTSFFFLLNHEEPHGKVHRDYQPSFCMWLQGLLRPQVLCTPSLCCPVASSISTQSQQQVLDG